MPQQAPDPGGAALDIGRLAQELGARDVQLILAQQSIESLQAEVTRLTALVAQLDPENKPTD
jgi:hypothetical protein